MIKLPMESKDVSDGYHTFGELYDHRCVLFLALCLGHKEDCFWKKDFNTEGWFLLYWLSPHGQVSYHLPEEFFHLAVSSFVMLDENVKFDGHTSGDVLLRLKNIVDDAKFSAIKRNPKC